MFHMKHKNNIKKYQVHNHFIVSRETSKTSDKFHMKHSKGYFSAEFG